MTLPPSNPSADVTGDSEAVQTLAALRHEIERRFGNCMLRLQRLENVVKALLAQHDITINQTHPGAIPVTVPSPEGLTTFGMAVNTLLATLLVPETAAFHDSAGDAAALQNDADDLARQGTASARMRLRIGMAPAEHDRIGRDLRALVRRRNDLVHHFLNQHDLSRIADCRAALVVLETASGEIAAQAVVLHDFARDLQRVRGVIADPSFMRLVLPIISDDHDR